MDTDTAITISDGMSYITAIVIVFVVLSYLAFLGYLLFKRIRTKAKRYSLDEEFSYN